MHDPAVRLPPDTVEGCGFGARAAAFFIDLIYLLLLSMFVAAVVHEANGAAGVALVLDT